MAKTTAPLLQATATLLERLGERLRLARLRRCLTARQVAERAGMTPVTLRNLERGGAGVTMGAYLSVMQVLGIEKDLDLVGAADLLGRELQDAHLTSARKSAVRSMSSTTAVSASAAQNARARGQAAARDKEPAAARAEASVHTPGQRPASAETAKTAKTAPLKSKSPKAKSPPLHQAPAWQEKGGFASASSLADLLGGKPAPRRKRA